MTAAHARTSCCRDRSVAAHHDRLLQVDVDVDALLELLEMAVTWHELDYGQCAVLGPVAWSTFAEDHEWTRRERAEQAFALALDIVGRGVAGPPPLTLLAPVIDLVRS
jgi:hypothetical protein